MKILTYLCTFRNNLKDYDKIDVKESVQENELLYDAVLNDDVAVMENQLEKYLREEFLFISRIEKFRNSIENNRRPLLTKFANKFQRLDERTHYDQFRNVKSKLIPSLESFKYQTRSSGYEVLSHC